MATFESFVGRRVEGKVTMVDRLIIHGHLTSLVMHGGMQRFLGSRSVLLKDFGSFAKRVSEELVEHAKQIAASAGRPYEYLYSAMTAARGRTKEEHVRSIAERDGVEEGLVAVLSAVEPCRAFDVRGNRSAKKLEIVRRDRKCLHIYFYFIDREFGLMHVRLQTWLPMQIQVYVNGREYLARQLAARGIEFDRYDNALTHVGALDEVEKLAERFVRMDWPRVLDRFARRVNPVHARWMKDGMFGYLWTIRQCEVATDLMFPTRTDLVAIMPDLYDAALRTFSAEDVMRFLGRKPNGNFKAEVCTEHKQRPEGRRVKHRLGGNSIKMYDKLSVLRIETTFNQPRYFKVLRLVERGGHLVHRWCPIGTGIGNLYRYVQVASASNERYLQALANVQLKGRVVEQLDSLSRSHRIDGQRVARLRPFEAADNDLFAAVLRGEHLILGFRNRDIQRALFHAHASTSDLERRRRARISRFIAKLRGHGLVSKVQGSHLYRVTPTGMKLMSAAVRIRHHDYADAAVDKAA
jgi:hypothetical protein